MFSILLCHILHVMKTPTDQPTETLTGLGATGVDLAFAHVVGAPLHLIRCVTAPRYQTQLHYLSSLGGPSNTGRGSWT